MTTIKVRDENKLPEMNFVLPEMVGEFEEEILELYLGTAAESKKMPFICYEWFGDHGALDSFCHLVSKYFHSKIGSMRGLSKDYNEWTLEEQEEIGMELTAHYTWFESMFLEDLMTVLDFYAMSYETYGPYPAESTTENVSLREVW